MKKYRHKSSQSNWYDEYQNHVFSPNLEDFIRKIREIQVFYTQNF
ncbi:hypothetical protein X781_22300 [Mannheimia sp. USDA-ARS-USMARC-1261]|nr:hypothetical protein [Mannheimia sp. USDA-ARS-USMARC-1261]AHG74375.1 hypothetical protein X781_22300 [Mannheimia sp. USDA-ARS-USMARC-1261]